MNLFGAGRYIFQTSRSCCTTVLNVLFHYIWKKQWQVVVMHGKMWYFFCVTCTLEYHWIRSACISARIFSISFRKREMHRMANFRCGMMLLFVLLLLLLFRLHLRLDLLSHLHLRLYSDRNEPCSASGFCAVWKQDEFQLSWVWPVKEYSTITFASNMAITFVTKFKTAFICHKIQKLFWICHNIQNRAYFSIKNFAQNSISCSFVTKFKICMYWSQMNSML